MERRCGVRALGGVEHAGRREPHALTSFAVYPDLPHICQPVSGVGHAERPTKSPPHQGEMYDVAPKPSTLGNRIG